MLVCHAIYDLFNLFGVWPTWGRLDDVLDTHHQVTDPWTFVSGVNRTLLYGLGPYEPADDQIVGLSIAGLATVPSASEDLGIFIATLAAVADALAVPVNWSSTDTRPDLTIGPDWIRDHVALPAAGRDQLLARQLAFWRSAGLASVLLTPPDDAGGWSVTPNRKQVRHFRGVLDAEDYLNIENRRLTTSTTSGPLSRTSSSTPPDPADQTISLTTHEGSTYTFNPAQPLGRGTSGTVFAGWDSTGEAVAVKRVALNRSFDTDKWIADSRYAEREYDALNAVAPQPEQHVVPRLGHLIEDAWFTLVYPRADFSLDDVVALVVSAQAPVAEDPPAPDRASVEAARVVYGSGPTLEQVRTIALDLAKGLAQLHEAGVIHRDLKPANAVYLAGRWCWTDLGISRDTARATSTYTWREHGTPAYQAPEAAAGGTAVHRSDVYSLGCTLHQLTLGRLPFPGPNFLEQHRVSTPELDEVTDQSLRLLLTTMLKKQAAARPSAEEVIERLQATPGRMTAHLQDLAITVSRREDARTAAATRLDARTDAQYAARDKFEEIWSSLRVEAETAAPGFGWGTGQDAWIMRLGDRRLLVQLGDSQEKQGPALVLGTVSVETLEDNESVLKSEVANIAALLPWRVDEAPIDQLVEVAPTWHLFRMAANYIAPTQARVSQSRHDGRGAVGFGQLDDYLLGRSRPGHHPPAVVAHEEPLTAEALLALFVAEVQAIDDDLNA